MSTYHGPSSPMPIHSELLQRTREAGAKLAAAELQVQSARKEYHALVRRMHLAGSPLREIAQALELSHQRVQQIVDGAGGSWWRRVWRSRNARGIRICTFCGKSEHEVERLIAGPKAFICGACVVAAEQGVFAGSPSAARNPLKLAGDTSRARCSFCGKRRATDRPILTGRDNICGECLEICSQILMDSRP
jgi:hypothetical protein